MAKRRPSLLQLKKYDVTQKVIAALTNVESRAILFATVKAGRTAPELASRLRIPLSTVYKKISELEEIALIDRQITFNESGGRVKVCKARINAAEIHVSGKEPRVVLSQNTR